MAAATVVATADIHMDGGRHGGINPATGRRRAWESTHAVWLHIVDHAVAIDADAVVIGGDSWVNGWPKAEVVEMVADGIRLLESARIPVVIFDGNHELIARNRGHRSPIEHFQDMEGVHVLTHPDAVTLGSGLQIACLPWPNRAELLEPDEMDGLTPTEIDELVAARAADVVAGLADRVDPGRGPVMLAAHATVGDAMVGSTKRGSEMALAELFAEPVVSLGDLDCDPWQHVTLGHIHRRQQMGERCWYVGSPDRLDFSDEDVEKAFSVITLDDDGTVATVEAVATPARRFTTVTVPDGGDVADIGDLLPAEPEGVVVRVELPAGSDMAATSDARRAVEATGASLVRVVAPPLPRSDATKAVADEDVTPMEGLELWLATQTLPVDQADRLREKAAALLGADPIGGEA